MGLQASSFVDNVRYLWSVPDLTTVFTKEGEPAILPCSLLTKMNIERELFDWKRGRQDVFLHEMNGDNYNNGRSGQDEQFKRRVSYFPEELKNGNASLLFKNPKVSDTGNYSCDFPLLQPNRQTFYIQFIVYPDPQRSTLKDMSGQIRDAAPQPRTAIVDAVENGVLLKCSTRGASPQPELEWQDSDGNVVPADKPQISTDSEGRYNIDLYAAVTKTETNDFRCIAKQASMGHMIHDDIHVPGEIPLWYAADPIQNEALNYSIQEASAESEVELQHLNGNVVPATEREIPRDGEGISNNYAAPQPRTKVDAVENEALLNSSIQEASAEPEVELQHSNGNVIAATEREIPRGGEGHCNNDPNAVVTETNGHKMSQVNPDRIWFYSST
uniref:butyrophilin subfamily 2 member A2-like n=1 Tax=Centroberyx gerrardi TaxID=166262 RepID=UPI003AB061D9